MVLVPIKRAKPFAPCGRAAIADLTVLGALPHWSIFLIVQTSLDSTAKVFGEPTWPLRHAAKRSVLEDEGLPRTSFAFLEAARQN